MNPNALRAFNVRDADLETLTLYVAFIKMLVDGIKALNLETPDWLNEKYAEMLREISTRTRAEKLRRLENLKSKAAALKTPEEKRKEIAEEIELLTKELA